MFRPRFDSIYCSLFLGAGVLATAPALAFHLGTHALLTQASLQALPDGSRLRQFPDRVVSCCLSEDKNLFTKWFLSSHYYDPIKPMPRRAPTWRSSAVERVRQLEAALLQSRTDADRACWAGRLLHYVQDLAVPAHVVPVSHAMGDGFESFVQQHPHTSRWIATARSRMSSDALAPYDEISRFTDALAFETWSAAQAPPWNTFWKPRSSPGFGSYGDMGNRFGDVPVMRRLHPELTEAQAREAYAAFARRRVERAVHAGTQLLSNLEHRL